MKKYFVFLAIVGLLNFSCLLGSCSKDEPKLEETEKPGTMHPDDNDPDDENSQPDKDPLTWDESAGGFEIAIIGNEAAVQSMPDGEEVYIPHYVTVDEKVFPVTTILNGAYNGSRNNIDKLYWPNTIKKVEEKAFIMEEGQYINELYVEDLYAWCLIDFGYSMFVPSHYVEYNSDANPIRKKTKVSFNGNDITEGRLEIPSGITEIKPFAFGEININSVYTGTDVETIGYYAFYKNESLKEVSFGDNLIKIQDSAFAWSDIKTVKLPSKVNSIEKQAFYYVENLYLPSSVMELAGDFKNIKEIHIDDLKSWMNIKWTYPDGQDESGPFGNEYTLFIGEEPVYDLKIPLGINNIDLWGFFKSSIKSVDFGNNIYKSINWLAFSYCNNLESLTVKGVNAMSGYNNYFINDSLKKLILDEGISELDLGGVSLPALEELSLPSSMVYCNLKFICFAKGFNTLIIKAKKAPKVNFDLTDPSDYLDLDKIKVYVPAESIEEYKAAEGWSSFPNILPLS